MKLVPTGVRGYLWEMEAASAILAVEASVWLTISGSLDLERRERSQA
jgi:hypothetical protein